VGVFCFGSVKSEYAPNRYRQELPKLSMGMQSMLEPAFIGVMFSAVALVAGSYLSPASSEDKWQLFLPKK
jgi:hypothetical protein